MNDAFDDLERGLRQAVRARRRRRVRRTPVLALAGALLLGGGGAVAATRIARDPGAGRELERVVLQAVRDTRDLPACRPATTEPAFAALPLLREIADTLPALATAVDGVHRARVVRRLHGGLAGTVLRQTVRTIQLTGGVSLDVFVIDGARHEDRDPAACVAARRKRAAQLASGLVLAAAQRRLGTFGQPARGRQTLFVFTTAPGVRGSVGTGVPVEPGRSLTTGIIGSGSERDGATRYTGIAGPRVARVRAEPERGRSETVDVVEGFYSFALRRGLGPVRLRELDASGETIRTRRLRG